MKVKLIAKTEVVDVPEEYIEYPWEDQPAECDELAEMAGRQCYESWSRPNPATATNAGYLGNIITQGHFSVMEHATATFRITGVTRAFLLELERHRHLSYSVVSQRYVDESAFAMVEHPELDKLHGTTKLRIANHSVMARMLYQDIVEELQEKGDSRKTARGAARTVLPEGTETKLFVTGNMRAWRDVLMQRLSKHADREIREVAALLLAELRKIAPNTFQDFELPEAEQGDERLAA